MAHAEEECRVAGEHHGKQDDEVSMHQNYLIKCW